MSLSVVFVDEEDDVDGPFQLASQSGWEAVRQWSAPYEMFSLKALLETGEFTDTEKLADEVAKTLHAHPPNDNNVGSTLTELLINIGAGSKTETIKVVGDD